MCVFTIMAFVSYPSTGNFALHANQFTKSKEKKLASCQTTTVLTILTSKIDSHIINEHTGYYVTKRTRNSIGVSSF